MSHYDDLIGRDVVQRGYLRDTDDSELVEIRNEVGDLHDFAKVLADKLHELIELVGKQQDQIEKQRIRLDRIDSLRLR